MLKSESKIPIAFHFLYLLLAAGICFLYYKKIVAGIDLNALNSIDSVASFKTAKPYQFRLLIPLFFAALKPLYFLGEKLVYTCYDVIIVYLIVVVYQKLISEFIQNKKAVLWLAPVILYPVLWNYIILNESFQYYDFTAILLFTLGLYFIVKENFKMLLIVFLVGLINKETIVYLGFAYALYNYKVIFSKKIIFNLFILAGIFIAFRLLMNYLFAANSGDSFEIGFEFNKLVVKDFFHNRIYQKILLLNFGALYIFIPLLFFTARWKKFPQRKILFMNLAFIPYILLGIYLTYFTEIRVYTELIPMVTTIFIIYLSTFKKLNLLPVNEIDRR